MVTIRFRSLAIGLIVFLTPLLAYGGSGGVNAPQHLDKPILILISIDGLRWDFSDWAETPALDGLTENGVRAERLIPVFPTLTFPNHYSIATGLYPANHGLIGNQFPSRDRTRFYSVYDRSSVEDPSWYGGWPVWVVAERAGMVSAAFYFVGSEAAIQGTLPSYWYRFDADVPGCKRVEQVLDWLSLPKARRPHVITLYFEDVDVASHSFGPASPQGAAAIERVDGHLAALLEGVKALGLTDDVYIVVVSDHGQIAAVSNAQPFVIESVANLEGALVVDDHSIAFIWLDEGEQHRAVQIRDAINANWNHGQAMLPAEAPESWQVSDAAGFADVIVQADPGYFVVSGRGENNDVLAGSHGWPREAEGMHGVFIAAGPGLPQGRIIPPIEAVDIYPLLMAILGLPVDHAIDGNSDRLVPLLSEQQSDGFGEP